jgi:hypothetical protein
MDSPRPALSRTLLCAAALSLAMASLAAPCAAQGLGDGSSQPDPGYRGPFLSWAGKTATPAPAASAPMPAAAPTPSPPQAAPPAPEPLPPPALPPPAPAPPAPTAYSGDGRAAPLAPAAMAAPPAPPASAAPVQMAQATPPAAPASAPVSARYYSLHRAYGISPDPDPAPVDRPMVLIGPPDNPPAQPPASDGASSDGGDSGAGDAAATPHHPNGPDAN